MQRGSFGMGKRQMVALRPVATAAGWRILVAMAGAATIQDTKRANHDMPLLIHNGKASSRSVTCRAPSTR